MISLKTKGKDEKKETHPKAKNTLQMCNLKNDGNTPGWRD